MGWIGENGYPPAFSNMCATESACGPPTVAYFRQIGVDRHPYCLARGWNSQSTVPGTDQAVGQRYKARHQGPQWGAFFLDSAESRNRHFEGVVVKPMVWSRADLTRLANISKRHDSPLRDCLEEFHRAR